jgi:aminoglycoside phosphotransferase (APT) family kinase protein
MFRDLDCTAVFDWEDVSLSSPLYDLARWFLADHLMAVSTGTSRLAGIPARHEVVELWESRTGYVADELRWFEVFVCCCGAGTLARTAQLQREIFGKSVSVDGRMLAPLMARLERLLAGAEVE